jgi:CheY-like chemotaxis protein
MGLVVRPNAGSAHIRADPSQIEQVVVNLVINARDAMPQGGTLKIETSTVDGGGDRRAGAAPGGHVALTVSDTGIGMSAETLSHCFEPFFTTKDPRRGTGLGLATAYGIVRQSGGDLWATSEPGVGTTFTMQLPLVDALPEGSTPDSRHHSPAGEETVLLVEDEDEVRWLARRALDRSGYRVLEATDGVEALDLARASSHPIDVLVTDVVMPRLGGVELSEALEQEGLVRRVLFISGYLDRAPGLEGAAIDTDKLLAKPFRAEDLLSRVRVVLDR